MILAYRVKLQKSLKSVLIDIIKANQHRSKRECFSFLFSFKSKFSFSVENFSLPSLKAEKPTSNDLKLSAMYAGGKFERGSRKEKEDYAEKLLEIEGKLHQTGNFFSFLIFAKRNQKASECCSSAAEPCGLADLKSV